MVGKNGEKKCGQRKIYACGVKMHERTDKSAEHRAEHPIAMIEKRYEKEIIGTSSLLNVYIVASDERVGFIGKRKDKIWLSLARALIFAEH